VDLQEASSTTPKTPDTTRASVASMPLTRNRSAMASPLLSGISVSSRQGQIVGSPVDSNDMKQEIQKQAEQIKQYQTELGKERAERQEAEERRNMATFKLTILSDMFVMRVVQQENDKHLANLSAQSNTPSQALSSMGRSQESPAASKALHSRVSSIPRSLIEPQLTAESFDDE
jgi:hypothetical protein